MQRFLERHARAFLWLISGGLLLMMALVAGHHGAFGEKVKVRIEDIETAINTFVNRNAQSFEYATKVVGAIVTVLTAIFGIVKGIHYSERRLPIRLAEFTKQTVRRIEDHASLMVPPVVAAVTAPTVNTRLGDPLFFVGPLNRALDDLGSPTVRGVPRAHDKVIEELGDQIKLAEAHLKGLQDLRANALLARGAATTAKASYHAQDGVDGKAGHESAERDFHEACACASTRVHAFELRGLLRARQGNLAGALADFAAMLEAAPEEWCVKARAQRYKAETLIKQANGTNGQKLREARRELRSAWISFPNGKTIATGEHQELARNRITYADLSPLLGGSKDYIRKTLEEGAVRLKDSQRCVDPQLALQIAARIKKLEESD